MKIRNDRVETVFQKLQPGTACCYFLNQRAKRLATPLAAEPPAPFALCPKYRIQLAGLPPQNYKNRRAVAQPGGQNMIGWGCGIPPPCPLFGGDKN
jgi:hypothetical protein